MSTTANALLAEVACYANQTDRQWLLIKLGLLKQILLSVNPMADTSPSALMQAAGCYACQSPGFWPLFELGLLKQIVDGGGLGAGGGVLATTGDPEGVVTSSATPALAYDCASGALYVFCGVAGTNVGWQALII